MRERTEAMGANPLALQIEGVTAADLRPPLVDDYVYLAGRPPRRSFVSFVGQAVEVAGNGHVKDPRLLKEEWRVASEHVERLEEEEAGWADNPEIVPLGPHLEPLRDRLFADPLFHHAFDSLPTDVGIVELDRLVVFQKHINLEFVRQLKEQLGPAPSEEELFRLCLPYDHPQPPIKWMRTRSNTFVFVSPSNDLRFLDSVVLQGEQISAYPPPGAISGVIGLVVGFGSNFLNVIHTENRIVLNNGSHRAFALRDMGVTHAPCIIQHVSTRDELASVATSDLRRNPDYYLKSARPPMFKDYFDANLRKVVPLARTLRQVRVKFEIDEGELPAI